jgi:hypothetical protein
MYKTSIHQALGLNKDAQRLYRELRNPNYNYLGIVQAIGIDELKKILEARKGKSKGWLSEHKIYFIVDETLEDRTTDGFEEIKSLPKHAHCHVVVNLLLVINNKDFHIPINQRVLPAVRENGSKVDVAIEMIEEILSKMKEEGYKLKGLTLCGDREYLCGKIGELARKYEISFTCKLKRTTVLKDLEIETALWMQVKKWIRKEWENDYRGFKWSSQLSAWCRKHDHAEIRYKSKIFESKVLGKVKVVMEVDENAKDQRDVNVYVSTDIAKSAVRIIRDYREIRWIIEPFHRNEKQELEVEKSYQGTSFVGIIDHNVLKCLGYTLLMLWKKEQRKSTLVIGQLKRFLNEEYLKSENPGKSNVFVKKSKKSIRK